MSSIVKKLNNKYFHEMILAFVPVKQFDIHSYISKVYKLISISYSLFYFLKIYNLVQPKVITTLIGLLCGTSDLHFTIYKLKRS